MEVFCTTDCRSVPPADFPNVERERGRQNALLLQILACYFEQPQAVGGRVNIDGRNQFLQAATNGIARRGSGGRLKFTRGSALGDFSINIAKVVVRTNRPVANPVELEVVYGTLFGTAFDTGDLWKFCNELRDKLQQLPWAEIVQ